MKKIEKLVRDTRAVVVYQDKEIDGRQRLVARSANGKVLFVCRRIKALANYLRGKHYNFYEYTALPRSTKEALSNLRAAEGKKHRPPAPAHPKLADVWPS